ncbi:MAG TPA: DUF4430 domain-containing protein [Thermoleophilaceae bacterium]|nr:DUF4430 domain-containing protein [Thermoleophilaceae bacterium]
MKTTDQPPSCNGSGSTKQLPGSTALGVLADGASVDRRLDPLLVSDEFSFGLFVCGIGGSNANGTTSYWSFKVNHVLPEIGADQYAVRPGDDVLWYLVDGARNSGNELVLTAPTRAVPGAEFVVHVQAYDFAGNAQPAAGAVVTGGAGPAVADSGGEARVTPDGEGTMTLRAVLEPNVPSAPTKVCVNDDLASCGSGRPGRIWGTRRGESIRGTAGRDRVRAGRGADVINVRRGNVDTVRCGSGRDLVRAGRRDRISRNCEVVRRRGRQ